MKLILLSLLVFLTIGVTLSATLLDQFGMDRSYLFIGLGALMITGLVAFRGAILIVIILVLSLAINMPEEMLAEYYLDRDILIVVTLLMIVFPLIYREFVGKK